MNLYRQSIIGRLPKHYTIVATGPHYQSQSETVVVGLDCIIEYIVSHLRSLLHHSEQSVQEQAEVGVQTCDYLAERFPNKGQPLAFKSDYLLNFCDADREQEGFTAIQADDHLQKELRR